MDLQGVLIIAAMFINLVAFGGFAVWARGWFISLKGTVDTQAQTIAALQSVVDATDWPKMLDRIQAYRKFVDQEKEAIIADLQRQFAEERANPKESGAERLRACEEFLSASTEFLFEQLAYVPRETRQKLIDGSNFDEKSKNVLRNAASKFPDLSQSGLVGGMKINPGTGLLAAMGITPETRLSDIFPDPPMKKR
jgi:hypothetical protein